jgi:pyruvate/2-oxoglutarate dehydrogenase complex dihydrolipoamide acyltransferase (E2) component
MDHDIVIPQVGEAVSELTIVKWLKAAGDRVEEGEFLFELDTEKSVMEIESVYSGTLTRIIAEAGEKVSPLQVVARITSDE